MAKKKEAPTKIVGNWDIVAASLQQKFGGDVFFQLGGDKIKVLDVEVVPTGLASLDEALGCFGIPKGRIIECFGPESCLAEETFIQYEIRTRDGKRQNHKGGSIGYLHKRFHKLKREGLGSYQRPETVDSEFFAPCINEEGRVFQNRIVDVVDTGERDCLQIATRSGLTITCTPEHKFMTETGFVEAEKLLPGSVVFIHNQTPYKKAEGEEARHPQRKYLYVKHHPVAGTKVVAGHYKYKRLARARAVIEAEMNGLSLNDYVMRLNDNRLDGLSFLERSKHVHHIDEDWTNDSRENLVVLDPSIHTRDHAIDRHNNLRYSAVPDIVTEIHLGGRRHTYDVRMESPFNNYVAGGFVVHNSGKTTLALTFVKQFQRKDPSRPIVLIDWEHALDVAWMKRNGVSFDNLWISQPQTAEDGLNILTQAAESGVPQLIVTDSTAAAVPKAELEGEVGDAHVGLLARWMGQTCRKVVGPLKKYGTTWLAINQTRCLPLDTMILRNGRLSNFGEVIAGDKLPLSAESETRVVSHVLSDNVSGKKVTARLCPPFRLSNNHRQPVISDGQVVEKDGGDIATRDWLIQPILPADTISDDGGYTDLSEIVSAIKARNLEGGKRTDLPTTLDERLAFFLGCCYSDGNLFSSKRKADYRIQFSENNRERLVLVRDSALELFPSDSVKVKETKRGKSYIKIGRREVFDFLTTLGCKEHGCDKIIPEPILHSKRSVIVSFLRGASFDTHGFNEHGFIFTHDHQRAAHQFAEVLFYFGIFANVCENHLHITGSDAIKFRDLIGFAEPTKATKSQAFRSARGARGKYDVVPHSYCKRIFEGLQQRKVRRSKLPYYSSLKMCLFKGLNASRERLVEMLGRADDAICQEEAAFLRSNRFAEVEDVQDTTFEAMDIETDSHLFIASRFLTHNSGIGPYAGEALPGGNAMKFFASQRIRTRKCGEITEGGQVIGIDVEVEVKKNKIAPPFRTAVIPMLFGSGFSRELSLLDAASNMGIIEKAGSWYSYGERRLGQGRVNVGAAIAEDPALFDEVYDKFLTAKKQAISLVDPSAEPEEPEPTDEELIGQPEAVAKD